MPKEKRQTLLSGLEQRLEEQLEKLQKIEEKIEEKLEEKRIPTPSTISGASTLKKIGTYAFLLGVLVAILTGLMSGLLAAGTLIALLVILGLIVGVLNISQKEVVPFLVAALALGLGAQVKFSTLVDFGTYIDAIMANIVIFVAPAALIVALKTIYVLGREG